MIEPILRRLVEHKRRKTIVIVLTIMTGLLVVLPAADEYNAAKERRDTADVGLVEMETQFQELPRFEQLYETKMEELKQLEARGVSEAVAQRLRNDFVELVRQTGCTMRQIRLGDALRRDWTSEDHAVRGADVSNRGDATPYQLETRQISLSVTGSMANLNEFMARVHQLDFLVHTKNVVLKRGDDGGNTAIMDMDILLFDLVKKPPA